jgi:transposase-like protein
VATRARVRELLDSGLTYEMVARELGIRPGLAYMIATGRPADDDSAPAQNLFEPPAHNPTRNETVNEWVRMRAHRDLGGAGR